MREKLRVEGQVEDLCETGPWSEPHSTSNSTLTTSLQHSKGSDQPPTTVIHLKSEWNVDESGHTCTHYTTCKQSIFVNDYLKDLPPFCSHALQEK